jgi:hypothetical protein
MRDEERLRSLLINQVSETRVPLAGDPTAEICRSPMMILRVAIRRDRDSIVVVDFDNAESALEAPSWLQD